MLAPLWRSTVMFWLSRAEATIVASGSSRRAVSTTSTEVSSRSVATTTRAALSDLGGREHLLARRVARRRRRTPSAMASSTACRVRSTTTICAAGVPWSRTACTALRPVTPNPTTTVCAFTRCLQRLARNSSRLRWVSTSTVVPTSTMRKRKRSGVMTRVLVSRATSEYGVMSPYPVVESETVA